MLVDLIKLAQEKFANQLRDRVWDVVSRLDEDGDIALDLLCTNIPDRDAVRSAVDGLVNEWKVKVIDNRVGRFITTDETVVNIT